LLADSEKNCPIFKAKEIFGCYKCKNLVKVDLADEEDYCNLYQKRFIAPDENCPN
jgi:hypothetical protein